MNSSTLHIKNMVCNRCIRVVREELNRLDVNVTSIELGKVELSRPMEEPELEKFREVLTENGFELIDNKKSVTIESIKKLVIELIYHNRAKEKHINVSDYIAREIGHDYSYLSNLFSSVEGITLEKYIINQKIERVKEWLVYDELTLNEMADRLGYSSVQHLSTQFKKVTGLTPSHFKHIKENRRKAIDEV